MYRSILAAFVILATTSSFAAEKTDLDRMQGKWEVKKTNEDGQKFTQTIEMNKEKMVFKIINADGETVFVAKADVKTQKLGPFQTFTISKIRHGRAEDSLESSDEERSYVYQLGYDTLAIVSNIDAERERPPVLDVYKKVSAK